MLNPAHISWRYVLEFINNLYILTEYRVQPLISNKPDVHRLLKLLFLLCLKARNGKHPPNLPQMISSHLKESRRRRLYRM
jgi:hypothetical protein